MRAVGEVVEVGVHSQSMERELELLLVEEDLSFPPHSYSAGGFLMRSCLGSGWKLQAATPSPPPPEGEAGEWEWFEEPPAWKLFQGPGCLLVPQPAAPPRPTQVGLQVGLPGQCSLHPSEKAPKLRARRKNANQTLPGLFCLQVLSLLQHSKYSPSVFPTEKVGGSGRSLGLSKALMPRVGPVVTYEFIQQVLRTSPCAPDLAPDFSPGSDVFMWPRVRQSVGESSLLFQPKLQRNADRAMSAGPVRQGC